MPSVRVHVHDVFLFFFFNDTATTEIYTLSLHDALPICFDFTRNLPGMPSEFADLGQSTASILDQSTASILDRSEEHTSELQSRLHLVCRLLLEKKKKDFPDLTRAQAVMNPASSSQSKSV